MVLAKDQPQYLPLPPVALVRYEDGSISMISRYRLTVRERLRLFISGSLWCEQLTFGNPLQPQLLQVDEPLREAAK